MKTFNQKIEYLKENSTSLEFKEIYESLKDLASNNINQKDLTRILLERVEMISDKDSIIEDFLVKENRHFAIENFGLIESVSKIKSSPVYSYHALRYNLELVEKELLVNRKPEYSIVEGYLNLIKPYNWDNTVKEEIAKVEEKKNSLANEILVANTIIQLRNDKNVSLYKGIIEKLENVFNNIDKIEKNAIIKEFTNYAFNPIVNNFITNLKLVENANSYNVINSSKNATVKNIYTPVFIHEKGEFVRVQEMFYNIEGETITPIKIEEMIKFGNLEESFFPICRVLDRGAKIEENKVVIYKKNNTIELVDGETKKITLNGKELNLTESNLGNALLYSSVYRAGEESEIADVVKTFEHLNTIMELEFGKIVESNFTNFKSANIFNKDGNISITTIDTFNKKANHNSNLTGINAVEIVKEHLNFDISESLVEYLEVEKRELIVLESRKVEIINDLKIVESELAKLNNMIETDIMLKESVELKDLSTELETEIETLKEEYRKIDVKIKKKLTHNPINEGDPGVNVGDKVKIKGSGKIATVSSIDSNTSEIIVLPEGEDDSITVKANDVSNLEDDIEDKKEANKAKGAKESGEEEEESENVDEAFNDKGAPIECYYKDGTFRFYHVPKEVIKLLKAKFGDDYNEYDETLKIK